MNKNHLIFAAAFLIGALAALAFRSARHDPYTAGPGPAPAAAPAVPDTPAPVHPHGAGASPAAPQPVNTVCAICGMEVNPALPTALYQGRVIGFGCKTCPAKFAADPDRYGPAALANQVVE